MKKNRILWMCAVLMMAVGMKVCAQTSYEYQPFIKEGKIWNVTYLTCEGLSSYKETYTIKGDTIIEGKQYKKFFAGSKYAYALREDEKKVYAIASTDKFGKPNTKEKLWYDFDVNKGDVIDLEVSNLSVTEIDYILINGVKHKYFQLYETSKSVPTEHAQVLWVEGIGSYRSPDWPNGWFNDGGTATMDECYEDGLCIFSHDDFVSIKGNVNTVVASAAVPERRMLEQGKVWTYTYHHFEDRETPAANGSYYDHSMWLSYYKLEGDTVIDGRAYMKLYRWDDRDRNHKYFGAFREDEEGKVYMYDLEGNKQDGLVLDFSLHYDRGYFPDVVRIAETIKVAGESFRRYRYQEVSPDGSKYMLPYIAIEGIGFIEQRGLIFDPYAPEPDCICDYESLTYVYDNHFWFSASDFHAPKEIELAEGEQLLITNNNDFAFNLFRQARGETSSIMSPLSITFALGLLNNAAAGQTLEEINRTLGFGEAGADAINAFCKKMLDEANTLDEKTKALIANTIFVNEGLGYQLQNGFIEKANEFYNAQPQNRNFLDGETMDVINQWASDHTEGMIPSVLNKDTFNPLAVSYLLNAIYFKGEWADPFDVANTKDEAFGGGPAVPMMHKENFAIPYAENDLYQTIMLPYGNGAYSMRIFLPREDKTIGDVLEGLNGSNWQVSSYTCDVDLKLPRFETDKRIELEDVMSALGMPTAFSPALAEFPYFCNYPVYIGKMFQVAKIKLDEQGTEAAAVTVIGMETSGMPKRVVFHANRPFLYVISEQSTGAIFFIGQYTGGVKTLFESGIAAIKQNKPTDELYNLSGQRLNSIPAHGLYIQNGKKILK
jgi:serpin B